MAEPLFSNSDVSKPLGGAMAGTYLTMKIISGIISWIVTPTNEFEDFQLKMIEKEARTGKNVYAEFALGYNLYHLSEYDKENRRNGLRWLRKAKARGSIEAKEFLDFIGEN